MTIKPPLTVPASEFSETFALGMADRMAVSVCKDARSKTPIHTASKTCPACGEPLEH